MKKLLPPMILLIFAVNAFSEQWKLLGDFETGWRQQWKERKFTSVATEYRVVSKGGAQALMGRSEKSASGLWRMLDVHPVKSGSISWHWQVEHSLTSNMSERKKEGDDYAARVFVVFEPRFFSWRTRSICYVWASRQNTGSVYPSPYASNVGTVVLESGDTRAGEWIAETRDFVADYKKFFGESPTVVSAVAIMVDTDNTGSQATAYFNNITLTVP